MEGNGNDLTRQYAARYIPKPTYASVAEQLSRNTHWVSEGGKETPEVCFADPNCIFCHKFWKQARSWMADLGSDLGFKAGPWTLAIREVLALVLLAAAVFFSASLVPQAAYPWLWGSWLALVLFWGIRRFIQGNGAVRVIAATAAGLALAVVMVFVSPAGKGEGERGLAWQPYSSELLAEAKNRGATKLLEFLIPTAASSSVSGQSFEITTQYPRGRVSDITLDDTALEVYDDGASIRLLPDEKQTAMLQEAGKLDVKVRVQACSEDGVCLAPSDLPLTLDLDGANTP
jgi:hypothetical protein